MTPTINAKVIGDLRLALKDFEPMVKNPKQLWNGRELLNFSLRPREAWANWLLCAVLQQRHGERVTFAEDRAGDGIIVDRQTGNGIPTEHVSALNVPEGKELAAGEQRIIDAINKKIDRGPQYAEGKFLVVFFDGAGEFHRSEVRKTIFGRHNFLAVFCIGLLTANSDGYSYVATEFRDSYGDQSISFKIEINGDFTDWTVSQVMH